MTNATPPTPEPSESARKEQEQAAKDALARVNQREADAAWRSIAYLLTGPAVYGGLGWLLDRWLETSWIAVLGICGGMGLSLYLIWIRYGTH